MKNNTLLISLFLVLVAVQLYVPASMIIDREVIISSGTIYKFKTAPVDPSDPFRGKYIDLRYDNTAIQVEDVSQWKIGDEAYVQLTTDNEGFAKLSSISKEPPTSAVDYLKLKVDYVTSSYDSMIVIDIPFDRYYMEESKAYDAELLYRETQRDTTKDTYSLVSVKDGKAVLTDVLINGVSIKDLVNQQQNNNETP